MLSSMWDSVVEIDVSRNMISQIDALNQFRNLKILRASENYILDVSLTQPRLEEIYLEHNQISRFPLLT
jgi:Leucine-rich repeat (LRR) protein